MGLVVLQVKPEQTQIPTNIIYGPVDSTPLPLYHVCVYV